MPQELRAQLHSDSQQQKELLDQQHDFIQELESQQQQLRVSSACQTPGTAKPVAQYFCNVDCVAQLGCHTALGALGYYHLGRLVQ